MYITTQHSKDTCSDTSAYAEASDLRPTFLRYYTLGIHPPTPIRNFLEDMMHGNMRYDIAPPPPPTQAYDHIPQTPTNYIRLRPARPLDWYY
eukprot:8538496-Pyramimonas_sp.AAC.1